MDNAISQGERFKALRALTGMNRKDFSSYLGIPYRTMQHWELNRRHMPEYVFFRSSSTEFSLSMVLLRKEVSFHGGKNDNGCFQEIYCSGN